MPKRESKARISRTRAKKRSLTELGKGATRPKRHLEAFPNSYPERDTIVTFHCTEFTCLCPVTGQPDFGTVEICYIPDKLVLESKSLKLYLWTYREIGIFHEDLVNELLDALFTFLKPRWIKVTGRFNVRGGISIDVTVERAGARLKQR